MLQAAVFDLDGTLLNTIPDIAASLNYALAGCGFPTHSVEKVTTFVGDGIINAIRRALPPEASEDDIWQVHTLYQQYYPAHCAVHTQHYPGIRELLAALQERGIPMAVLSNKTDGTAKRVAAHYFPDIAFRCVCGRVPERPLKPDPAAAGPILEAIALPAERIAYVGDSGTDMVFGSNVGMVPVAAPWGYRSREELVRRGAVHVLEQPANLLRLLMDNR